MTTPEDANTVAGGSPVERGGRARRLQVGQCWGAAFVQDGQRTTGYTFKLVHEETYWDRTTKTRRKCWLGVKLHLRRDPHGQDHAQCWWFDDRGTCTDKAGWFEFRLTRKRPNAELAGPPKAGPGSVLG